MKKKFHIVLTGIIAAIVVAGCAVPTTGTVSSAPVSEAVVSETVAAEAETQEAIEEVTGEITEINVMLADFRGVGDKAQPIVDAVNAITEKEIGVRANVSFASSDYQNQLGLMISSNEQLDVASIMPMPPANFSSLIANRQAMDITEYMQNEGKETLDMMGDYLEAMSIDGKIYGVPCYRNWGSGVYLIMRQDILDDLGITEKASSVTSWTEVEEVFAAVREGSTVMPIGGNKSIAFVGGAIYSADKFEDSIIYDGLGDSMNVIFTDDSGQISLLPENPDFRAAQDRVKTWREMDWVYKDSTVTDDHADTLTKAGVIFSSIQTSEMGVEVAKEEGTGYKVVCVELNKNLLASSYIDKFGLFVPVTAQEPEAAVLWINEFMTNPEMENLLIWGIEGEDYVVNDGIATFPEGIDASNVRYHEADFLFGNYFNALPWDGSSADFREQAKAYLDGCELSPYLGFSVDQSEIGNVVAALNSVNMEYKADILCGNYDDAKWDEYIAALKTADVDAYIAQYQEQLDAWKAE